MARRGFSLIELTIVLAIIIIVAAIAAPRFSRGVEGASSSALAADLSRLNRAVDIYAAEHGGLFPTTADIAEQLTGYTNAAGDVSVVVTAEHIYGPYLRFIPPVPHGPNRGKAAIGAAAAPGIGWIYDPATGRITPNLD